MVEDKEFREDLYYRINVIPIRIPPLRERSTDIPVLCLHFLEAAKLRAPTHVQGFTTEAMAKLIAYDWPGNVREMRNIIERLVATADGSLIELKHLPQEIAGVRGPFAANGEETDAPHNMEELKNAKRKIRDQAYWEVERKFVVRALDEAQWNVTKAADMVGMQRPNFHALMRKYGIKSREKGE